MNKLPTSVIDFLNYIGTIKGKSKNTIQAYAYDLEVFFKFMKNRKNNTLADSDYDMDNILINELDDNFIKAINLIDLYAFLSYVSNYRDNKSYARARKVACLRSYFKYLHTKVKTIDQNPAEELETPKIDSRHPIHLTLAESKKLLASVDGENMSRDFAIITLFLNCGLRLSELTGIDMDKISEDTLTVIGKGNKERTVYLNKACISAIDNYRKDRQTDGVIDRNALFLSERKKRISKRTVQHIVKKYIESAGLDSNKFSTHKLRHTAATLMYKYGNVDIRVLQQILGHENISTTQIYTHVDDERLRQAIKSNPLSEE